MTHALIIGGGIAGPVTAMALQRAGIGSTVYEAYPSGADHAGAFLVLFANGLEALAVIGADRPVREHSFPSGTVEFLSDTGSTLGTRPIAGSGDGPRPRTLPRAALYRALRDEATRRGIRVEYGKRLVSTSSSTSTVTSTGRRPAVTAVFADGTRAEGDLVIGADGIHSRTRALLDPAAPVPRHTGQLTVCGRTRATGHRVPTGTYRMMYGSRGFFGCTTGPDGTTYWFANIPGAELPRASLTSLTPGRWRGRVTETFADDRTPAAAIAAATGDDIVATNAYDIPTTPVWHDTRTVLVGDAAHATAPNAAQGASMAIEDGVVLARCLRDLPVPAEAFAAYERLRRERVERVVAMSAAMAGRVAATPEERRARDEDVARRMADDTGGGTEWLTGYRIDWGAPVH
ncbi:FAD-dependent monooxygenase [Streptomyces cinnamoneus]|uniref:FAD-dependent monooxygenase n=1 Tax=Streptomyces cinnamoneus TaxID=53446 RepID=UPI0033FC9432